MGDDWPTVLSVESQLTISFKGAQYPKDVILFSVFFYVRYGVSYRGLKEIMAARGVSVDYTTLNRWITWFSGAIAEAARRRKGPCDRSWRMDETYIKGKGAWVYLYRAVDKSGANTAGIKAINKMLKGFG